MDKRTPPKPPASTLPDIHAPPEEGSGPSRVVTYHPSMSGNNNIQGEVDELFAELGVSRELGVENAFGALKPSMAKGNESALLEFMVKSPMSPVDGTSVPDRLGPQPIQRQGGGYEIAKKAT